MAIPYIVGGTSNIMGFQDTAVSITVGKPAGTAAGDLLLWLCPRMTPATVATPTGWTLYGTHPETNGHSVDAEMRLFWRQATAAEPESYTCSADAATEWGGALLAIRGADATTPFENAATSSMGTGATITYPSVVTVSPENLILSMCAGISPTASYSPTPVGYTWVTFMGEPHLAMSAHLREMASIGTVPAQTTTWTDAVSTDYWRSLSITITPAAASPYVNGSVTAIGAAMKVAQARATPGVAKAIAGLAMGAAAGAVGTAATNANSGLANAIPAAVRAMVGSVIVAAESPVNATVAAQGAALAAEAAFCRTRVTPYREEQPYEARKDSVLVYPRAANTPSPADFTEAAPDVEMTFLSMVRRVQQLCGVSGAPIASTVNATGEMRRLCDMVNDAWMLIQTLHPDWNFLRTAVTFATDATSAGYSYSRMGLKSVQRFDTDSFTVREADIDETPLFYLSEADFKWQYQFGSNRTAKSRPNAFTVKPDKSITLGLAPDKAYTVTGAAFIKPYRFTLDDEVPPMPYAYHMAIVYRAMIAYGAYEAASEVYQHAMLEYANLIKKAEAECLPPVAFSTSTFC